jgi:hypothetical protein
MKEQLREFERASGLEIFGLGAKRVMWETALEKFAELIVRECAGLVDHVIMEDGTRRSDFIRKHFGVEE